VAGPGHPRGARGVPLPVLRDTIQPFPTFSEVYVNALDDLLGTPGGICLTAGQTATHPG